jgi:hypothetical protein
MVLLMERLIQITEWKTEGHPGYLGKKKDEMYVKWNEKYGEGNWRLTNEAANGEIFSYEDIIWKIYVPGYVNHFLRKPADAVHITDNFSYAYDKDLCSREEAFDIYALYNKEGHANQFHHVALNIALEYYLDFPFKGDRPLQVREGKPGTPDSEQPEGFCWSPGRILCVKYDLIPVSPQGWWMKGSIEDFYQSSKVLQARIK